MTHDASDGAEQLRLLTTPRVTVMEIATKLRVTKNAVYRWIHGTDVPTHDHQYKLWRFYRIPVSAWTDKDR